MNFDHSMVALGSFKCYRTLMICDMSHWVWCQQRVRPTIAYPRLRRCCTCVCHSTSTLEATRHSTAPERTTQHCTSCSISANCCSLSANWCSLSANWIIL